MAERHVRVKVRLRELMRRLIYVAGGRSGRDIEYDFARRQVTGRELDILDIGGCESLLPLELARKGHRVTVHDFRAYGEQHPNLRSVEGDFLVNEHPDASFDVVVLISAIEHVGFGSYGAPVVEDADLRVMAEVKRVLRPDGRVVITFPFASKETRVEGFERWYDIERVRRLFEGLHVWAEEYVTPDPSFRIGKRILRSVPAALEEITSVPDVVERFGYQCNAHYVVAPQPRAWLA